MILAVLFTIIKLTGVVGEDLASRVFFDCHNVKVGDPMTLTLDFLGEAEFKDLHPPKLSKVLDPKDWKVDDKSAKTQTIDGARRLTYRVRPLREGLLWFPKLDFEYENSAGEKEIVTSNPAPVRVKPGAQVEVAEIGEDYSKMPEPPQLLTELKKEVGVGDWTEDMEFQWARALNKPSAEAFAVFDFPEARMNEAIMSIKEGNWARAMNILHKLEWEIGQGETWEKAMIAALALKYDNPQAELPVWRKVLRPVLKFDWKNRLGLIFSVLIILVILGRLLGKLVRVIAVLMILTLPVFAEDPFAMMEEMMARQRAQMQNMMSFSFGGEAEEPIEVKAKVEVDKPVVSVGEEFHFIVSFDAPEEYSIGQVRITPSEIFGMKVTGQTKNLDKRKLSIPVRYDVPMKSRLGFAIDGMVSGKRESKGRGRQFSFTFSNSFHVDAPKISLEVKPLEGAPDNFSGIIANKLDISYKVLDKDTEEGDVVRIYYLLEPHGGFIPKRYLPEGVAFEDKCNVQDGSVGYLRFWINDGGVPSPIEIVYYNPETKTYECAR